jgi:hypothetical protein
MNNDIYLKVTSVERNFQDLKHNIDYDDIVNYEKYIKLLKFSSPN